MNQKKKYYIPVNNSNEEKIVPKLKNRIIQKYKINCKLDKIYQDLCNNNPNIKIYNHWLDDKIFFGNYESMNKCSKLYLDIINKKNITNIFPIPETFLHYYIDNLNLNIHKVNMLNFKFIKKIPNKYNKNA